MLTALAIKRPIAALVDQAQRTLKGEKEAMQPLAHPMTDEVAHLSQILAQLGHDIEYRSDYILEFASHLSHEFKTPVTSIQGAVELLTDHHATMTDEQQLKFFKNLAKDSQRLERLVYRLLEFAKADLKPVKIEKVELIHVLHGLLEDWNRGVIGVSWSPPCDALWLTMSQDTLESIVLNLLENAKQAGCHRIEIELQNVKGKHVTLSLADDGCGIDEATQAQLFTPFFSTKRQEGGTGLGLSISQSLLRNNHGSMSYQRKENQACSTQFTLLLQTL